MEDDTFVALTRMKTAMLCGYMDARKMVDLMQTHGLPLSLCATLAIERGLNIDFSGLRVELECIGKKKETIDSELAETRYFIDAKRNMQQ